MKKSILVSTIILATFVALPQTDIQAATQDSFVYPIRELTNESKTTYFRVMLNITDENPTPAPYNKVRDDYFNSKSSSEINVPSSDALHVLYLIMEKEEMNQRQERKYKKIKIELKSDTPVTLHQQELPIGIFKDTWLKLDNTITIDGSTTSPMLTNTKKRNTKPYADANYKPYNYNSNIVIEGGIWDSNRDENKVTSEGFTLGNASNVYVKNVTIKDVAGGHGIDAAGVNGLVIENSQFLGSALIGGDSDRDYNEAIQLDQMASSGPFGGSNTSWGYFDGSVTKNVYIASNTFGASNSPSTVPWHVGIGSHSVVKNVPYENIIIYKNNFYSMDNAGIRMTNYKNVLVSGNNFRKNDHAIKIYSTDYAFDYSKKIANKNVPYPAINDTITIKNNTFNYIDSKKWGVYINSSINKTHGLTKNVTVTGNKYLNSDATRLFYQHYAQNSKIADVSHYDIKGYVSTQKEAIDATNKLKESGFDVSYKAVFKEQLYQVSLPNRYTSAKTAEYTAYLIKKNTGANAYVKEEKGGKYFVYTANVMGEKRAKEIKKTIETNMQYTYKATYSHVNHANNLYYVGITKRFSTYDAAKKASDDFTKYAKVKSVITKESNGKYYVKTGNLVGKTRGEQVAKVMKQKGYTSVAYNTNTLAYYEITVHPFYGKTEANKQALHIKNTYNWIESIPVFTKD